MTDTTKILTRLPPHDIAAEEAVIGSLLLDGSAIDDIQDLQAGDFYHAPVRCCFEACTALKSEGSPIDQITVAHKLDKQEKLGDAGGVAYLSHLVTVVPTSLDIRAYADIVRETSTRRRLIAIGQQITESGYSQSELNSVLDTNDRLLLDVRRRSGTNHLVTPHDRADLMSARYEAIAHRDAPLALSTGLSDLDRQLGGGFYDGDLVVIGARPGMGKTTLMLQLANHMAVSKPILFASAEMPVASLSDRDVAQMAGVPINTIRAGRYSPELEGKVMTAIGEIAERQVYFYWERGITTGKILQTALAMQARYGLGAVFVDYLGLLQDDQGLRAYERVTAISRRLNEMKLTLNVPVITAHQLSREPEQQERSKNRRPRLSDLRDSGAIEQDADVVLFLFRENYYDHENTDTTTEFLIAKQRQGNTGRVKFYYDPAHQKYKQIAKEG